MGKLSALLKAGEKAATKDLWYHGTSADIKGGKLKPQGKYGDHNNLGPGINITRDPKMAEMYPESEIGASVWMGRPTGRYAPAEEFGSLVSTYRQSGLSNAQAVEQAHAALKAKGYAGIEDAERGDRLVFSSKNLRAPFPKPSLTPPRQRYELGGAMLGETYAVPATKRSVTDAFKIQDEPHVFKTDAGKKMLVVPEHTSKASPFGGQLNVVSEKKVSDPLEIDSVLKRLAVPGAIGAGVWAASQGNADAAPGAGAARRMSAGAMQNAGRFLDTLEGLAKKDGKLPPAWYRSPELLSQRGSDSSAKAYLSQLRLQDGSLGDRARRLPDVISRTGLKDALRSDATVAALDNHSLAAQYSMSPKTVAVMKSQLRRAGQLADDSPAVRGRPRGAATLAALAGTGFAASTLLPGEAEAQRLPRLPAPTRPASEFANLNSAGFSRAAKNEWAREEARVASRDRNRKGLFANMALDANAAPRMAPTNKLQALSQFNTRAPQEFNPVTGIGVPAAAAGVTALAAASPMGRQFIGDQRQAAAESGWNGEQQMRDLWAQAPQPVQREPLGLNYDDVDYRRDRMKLEDVLMQGIDAQAVQPAVRQQAKMGLLSNMLANTGSGVRETGRAMAEDARENPISATVDAASFIPGLEWLGLPKFAWDSGKDLLTGQAAPLGLQELRRLKQSRQAPTP